MSSPAEPQPPLPFEAWAELSLLQDDTERARRLAALAPGRSWAAIDEHWGEQLARDILATKMERVRHFAIRLAATPGLVDRSGPHGGSTAPMPTQLDDLSTQRMQATAASQLVGAPPSQPAPQQAAHQHSPSQSPAQLQAAQQQAAQQQAAQQQAAQQQAAQQQAAQPQAKQQQAAHPQGGQQQAAHPQAGSQQTSFVAAMGGGGRPQVPEPGQQHTVYGATAPRNELLAAEAASQWTAEQYAHFNAELQAAGAHTDAVFGRYGLNSPETREIVMEGWARRLDDDPALRARFEAALADLRNR